MTKWQNKLVQRQLDVARLVTTRTENRATVPVDKESALFMTLANPLQQQSAVQRTLVLAVSICFVSWWTLVYPYMRAHCARKFHLSWCYNLVGVFNVGVNILVERLTELYPSFCKYFFRQ